MTDSRTMIPRLGKTEKAMLSAVSTDETREVLCGLFVDTENEQIVATDGRILFYTEMDHAPAEALTDVQKDGEAFDGQIIPAEVVKRVTTGLPKVKVIPDCNFAYLHQGKAVTFDVSKQRTTVTQFEPIKADYPNWTQVLQKEDHKQAAKVCLSRETMEALFKAMKESGAPRLELTIYETPDNGTVPPMAGKFTAKDCRDINAIIMPMRVEDPEKF